MKTTLPAIVQNYCANNMHLANESMISADLPTPNITLSELLFPAFNTVMPQMFENVVPHLSKVKNTADLCVMVSTIHSLLSFAFKTQIFNKIIWKQVSGLLSQGALNQDLAAETQVALMLHLDDQHVPSFQPLRLRFSVKSHALKERIKGIQSKLAAKGGLKESLHLLTSST